MQRGRIPLIEKDQAIARLTEMFKGGNARVLAVQRHGKAGSTQVVDFFVVVGEGEPVWLSGHLRTAFSFVMDKRETGLRVRGTGNSGITEVIERLRFHLNKPTLRFYIL